MTESILNLRFVCDAHSSKPNPEYAKKPAKFFVGGFVKKAFEVLHPYTRKSASEHMWVEIKTIKDGNLIGELNNDPIYLTALQCGDEVIVKLSEIEDFLPPKKKTITKRGATRRTNKG